MSFGWHPRAHRAALDGMLMLTLEERGAYNTCLDLIYDREGPIPDDSRWLAGWMGVSVKKWAKVRAALIYKGKLYEVNLNGVPSLMNQRAAIELENQTKRSRKLSESGAKGGRNRAENEANSSKNNDEAQATLEASLKLKTETETKTVTDDDSASARFQDWDGESLDTLESLLREAAGDSLNAAAPQLCIIAPVLGLLRPGAGPACDLKLDVLPAIRAAAQRAPRRVNRWDYFVPMIAEARDRRLQGAPALAEVVPLRATGPPRQSITDQIAADNAEAERRAFEMLDAKHGRTN